MCLIVTTGTASSIVLWNWQCLLRVPNISLACFLETNSKCIRIRTYPEIEEMGSSDFPNKYLLVIVIIGLCTIIYLVSRFPSISMFAPDTRILSLVSLGSWNTFSYPILCTRAHSSRAVAHLTMAFWWPPPLVAMTWTTLGVGRFADILSKALLASLRRNLFVSAVLWRRGAASSSSSWKNFLNLNICN